MEVRTIQVPVRGRYVPMAICGLLPRDDGTATILQLPSRGGEVKVRVIEEEDATFEELADAWDEACGDTGSSRHRKAYRSLVRVADKPGPALLECGVTERQEDEDACQWALFALAKVADSPMRDIKG